MVPWPLRITGGAFFLLLISCFPQDRQGVISFDYSLWRVDNTQTLADIGCVAAGIDHLRVDLLLQGVQVGSSHAVCNAFGNGDAQTTREELGEFLAGFAPTTFNELRITLIGSDGLPVPFGIRLNGTDLPPSEQQQIDMPETVSLEANQEIFISMPGESNIQVEQEIQIILPP